jgi:hypothetical protein
MAQWVDHICITVAFILPMLLVLRWNLWGVLYGTIVFWGSLVVAGQLLSRLDEGRDAALLYHVWILFGWIAGLSYCVAIYAVKRLAFWIWESIRVRRPM